MAARPGTMPPNAGKGRRKGVPNRFTTTAKEAIAFLVDGNTHRLQGWLDEIAKKDPEAAYKCVLGLLEYCIPKLGRQELTGTGIGAPVVIMVSPTDANL